MDIAFNHSSKKPLPCLFGNKHLIKSTTILKESKDYIFQFAPPPIMNIPGCCQKNI